MGGPFRFNDLRHAARLTRLRNVQNRIDFPKPDRFREAIAPTYRALRVLKR
jgi:hypothetical protein